VADSTPLHIATVNDNIDSVKVLIEAGAGINILNRKGRTPLDLAKTNEAKAYLISKGARVRRK
jgi:ankyrin repeat protein